MSKEELLEYLEDISQQLDNIALDQIQFAISELQFFKEEYKKLEEENKKIKNSNDTLKGFVSSIFNDTFEKDFIPTSVIQNKLSEIDEKIKNYKSLQELYELQAQKFILELILEKGNK